MNSLHNKNIIHIFEKIIGEGCWFSLSGKKLIYEIKKRHSVCDTRGRFRD